MAHHGYVVKWGYLGACAGHNFAPLQVSRIEADRMVAAVRADVVRLEKLAVDLRAGRVFPELAKSGKRVLGAKGFWEDEMVAFERAPAWLQADAVKRVASNAENRARMGTGFANDLERLAGELHGTALREVDVKPAGGPKMHAVGGFGVLCAGSYMGAKKLRRRTTDRAAVTCPKCIARLEARAAKLAAK